MLAMFNVSFIKHVQNIDLVLLPIFCTSRVALCYSWSSHRAMDGAWVFQFRGPVLDIW